MRKLLDPLLNEVATAIDADEGMTHARRFRLLAGLASIDVELLGARTAKAEPEPEPEPQTKGRKR